MTQPFFVVRPTVIDDMNFVSSSVPENDHPIYDAATTYALGQRVIVTTGHHKIYESLVANNVGFFPPDNPAKWVEIGPTNRWAAFDESGGTKTTSALPITFTVMADLVDSVALLELEATSVRIKSTNGDGTFFDQTYLLEDQAVVNDFYDYFFKPISRKTEVITTDLPPQTGASHEITISGSPINTVGTFIIGTRNVFGFTQYNAQIGIIDYSRKEVDQFGRALLVRRRFSKRMSVTVTMEAGQTDAVASLLAELRATPALWVAAQDIYSSLTIYGFYRDWNVDIAFPTQTIASLEIEGLT